jgi:hypothetical protein
MWSLSVWRRCWVPTLNRGSAFYVDSNVITDYVAFNWMQKEEAEGRMSALPLAVLAEQGNFTQVVRAR